MARVAKKPKGTYHHGNLREAIVLAAAAEVRRAGAAELAIRAVAERVGVTHAAVYHHFEDRAAMLAGVAEHAFGELAAAMDRACDGATTALDRYRCMGLAYVRFALHNPRLYDAMFGAEATARAAYPDLARAAAAVFTRIRGAIVDCQREGAIASGSADEHTVFCWSAVHGFASLAVDRQLAQLPADLPDVDALAETIVRRVFSGLSARR